MLNAVIFFLLNESNRWVIKSMRDQFYFGIHHLNLEQELAT